MVLTMKDIKVGDIIVRAKDPYDNMLIGDICEVVHLNVSFMYNAVRVLNKRTNLEDNWMIEFFEKGEPKVLNWKQRLNNG